MSVAFRREGDDEHKEPRFELPIPPGPNLVTPRGLALIEAEVARFEAAAVAAAGESEEAQKAIARDLRYWRARLATARVAPPPPADEIAFGSAARIRVDGEERDIAIVGSDEADPAAGRIAFTAPLARAIIGAGAGDTVDFAGRADAIAILRVG